MTTTTAQEKSGYTYQPKPRVNYELLKSNRGKIVTLVGVVESIGENSISIKTTDNQTVKINNISPDSELARGTAVEIEGKVNQDLTIQGSSMFMIPEDKESLDFEVYDEMVKIINLQFRTPFMDL
eukprot:gene9666-1873_t